MTREGEEVYKVYKVYKVTGVLRTILYRQLCCRGQSAREVKDFIDLMDFTNF